MNNLSVSWDNFYDLHQVDFDNHDGYLNIPVEWLQVTQGAFPKPLELHKTMTS